MSYLYLILFSVLTLGIVYLYERQRSRHIESLIAELKELRSDNRALMEALVRSEGKPLIFRKSEPIEGVSWWANKPVSATIPPISAKEN
jgi:hypothetical protein